MVIDLRRCVGCNSCTVACKQENAAPPGVYFSKVLQYEKGTYPKAKLYFLPMLCMHCEDAPCLKACPTGATYRREDGIIMVKDEECMGCRYCIMACPYDARSYNAKDSEQYFQGQGFTPFEEEGRERHLRGVVEKCTFCAERLDQGKKPACAATCPSDARIFGDLDDPTSEVAKLISIGLARPRLEELGTRPSVYYIEMD